MFVEFGVLFFLGGMIEMLILRSVLFFDLENKCWRSSIVPDSTEVSIGIFDQLNENARDRQREEFLKYFLFSLSTLRLVFLLQMMVFSFFETFLNLVSS